MFLVGQLFQTDLNHRSNRLNRALYYIQVKTSHFQCNAVQQRTAKALTIVRNKYTPATTWLACTYSMLHPLLESLPITFMKSALVNCQAMSCTKRAIDRSEICREAAAPLPLLCLRSCNRHLIENCSKIYACFFIVGSVKVLDLIKPTILYLSY